MSSERNLGQLQKYFEKPIARKIAWHYVLIRKYRKKYSVKLEDLGWGARI